MNEVTKARFEQQEAQLKAMLESTTRALEEAEQALRDCRALYVRVEENYTNIAQASPHEVTFKLQQVKAELGEAVVDFRGDFEVGELKTEVDYGYNSDWEDDLD